MRYLRTIRRVAELVTALLLATASPSAAAPHVVANRGVQQLAQLDHRARVFAHPRGAARARSTIHAVGPITGEQTVLPVIAHAISTSPSLSWLEVRLPGRPNGHTGWIHASVATQTTTDWSITVDLAKRQVTVLKRERPIRTFKAVVGKPTTPTPVGTFFVEESVALSPSWPGAPYALALSARSDALRHFDGGPGQIALHGLDNLAGVPGTAVSHGCIRLSTPNITWLVKHIHPGVPVTITRN